jgi:hypothetical protein
LAKELSDERGKLRGEFNKKHLRQYGEADDEPQSNIQIRKREAEGVATDARMNHRLKDKENKETDGFGRNTERTTYETKKIIEGKAVD